MDPYIENTSDTSTWNISGENINGQLIIGRATVPTPLTVPNGVTIGPLSINSIYFFAAQITQNATSVILRSRLNDVRTPVRIEFDLSAQIENMVVPPPMLVHTLNAYLYMKNAGNMVADIQNRYYIYEPGTWRHVEFDVQQDTDIEIGFQSFSGNIIIIKFMNFKVSGYPDYTTLSSEVAAIENFASNSKQNLDLLICNMVALNDKINALPGLSNYYTLLNTLNDLNSHLDNIESNFISINEVSSNVTNYLGNYTDKLIEYDELINVLKENANTYTNLLLNINESLDLIVTVNTDITTLKISQNEALNTINNTLLNTLNIVHNAYNGVNNAFNTINILNGRINDITIVNDMSNALNQINDITNNLTSVTTNLTTLNTRFTNINKNYSNYVNDVSNLANTSNSINITFGIMNNHIENMIDSYGILNDLSEDQSEFMTITTESIDDILDIVVNINANISTEAISNSALQFELKKVSNLSSIVDEKIIKDVYRDILRETNIFGSSSRFKP